MDQKLTHVFNALSRADRFQLRTASLMKGMSSIVLDETRHSPWKFPLYFSCIACIASPLPIPGTAIIPIMLLMGWFKLGLTERSRWANERIREKFTHAALIADNIKFIKADPVKPSGFYIQRMPLQVDASKTVYRDMMESKRLFFSSVQNFFNPA